MTLKKHITYMIKFKLEMVVLKTYKLIVGIFAGMILFANFSFAAPLLSELQNNSTDNPGFSTEKQFYRAVTAKPRYSMWYDLKSITIPLCQPPAYGITLTRYFKDVEYPDVKEMKVTIYYDNQTKEINYDGKFATQWAGISRVYDITNPRTTMDYVIKDDWLNAKRIWEYYYKKSF